MSKVTLKFLYIVFALLFFKQIAFCQNFIKGIVFDEKNTPIKGVQVTLDDNKFPRTTDGAGSFGYEIKGNAPVSVRITKKGYTLMKWNFEEKEKRIKIILQEGDEWTGMVTDANKIAIANARIILSKINPESPRFTNKNGNFNLTIPKGTNSADFGSILLNDKEIESKFVNYDNLTKKINISFENEIIENINTKNNTQTNNKTNKTTIANNQNSNTLNPINTKENQDSAKQAASATDQNIQLLSSYKKELTMMVDELNAESKVLNEKNLVTRQKIQGILNNLVAQGNQISEEDKDKIKQELGLLRQTLTENSKSYDDIQARSKVLIDLLTKLLAEKDSLKNLHDIANQRFDSLKVVKEQSDVAYTRKLSLLSLFALFATITTIMAYFFIKREQKRKKELADKNGKINQINQELNKTLDTVKLQKDEIASKNTKITDSLLYAQRIQQAILPTHDEIIAHIPDYFTMLLPKDIVSGDFYFFAHQGDKSFFAVVDCTGHGVPGAFMSIIGNELLNEIINEKRITSPELVLEELHKGIFKVLHQKETNNRDGMDIGLLVIDKKAQKAEFAGAKNALVYIHDGQLSEVKGDRISIGGNQSSRQRIFTKHEIPLAVGTNFYLFSDGYQDQFGGKENKKYMIHQFRRLLLDIYQEPLTAQKEKLEKNIKNWMTTGNRNQIDDILVVGIKV
jgi:serine phosphatase RsbU (regulator of sigma subunit)